MKGNGRGGGGGEAAPKKYGVNRKIARDVGQNCDIK